MKYRTILFLGTIVYLGIACHKEEEAIPTNSTTSINVIESIDAVKTTDSVISISSSPKTLAEIVDALEGTHAGLYYNMTVPSDEGWAQSVPRDTVHNDTITIIPITDSLLTIQKKVGLTSDSVSVNIPLRLASTNSIKVHYYVESNYIIHPMIGPNKIYQLIYYRATNKFKFNYVIYAHTAGGGIGVDGHFFYNY